MSIRTQRAELLAAAKTIATRAHDEGRPLTPTETEHINRTVDQVKELDAKIVRAKADAEVFDRLRNDTPDGATGHLALAGTDAKGLARTIAARMMPSESKALVPSGSIITDMSIGGSPVTMGYAATGLLNVLPTVSSAVDYSYLRQITRTNNAAPVAPGALKPTSAYGLTRVTGRLKVVAHVSEPIDKYWLEDAPSLERFVSDELLSGLAKAVEAQVFAGTGIGEDFTGLVNVSGVQVQPYVTSPIITARTALTAVETIFGNAGGFYVMNPSDWQTIETATLSAGQYVLAEAGKATPVESAARRLWGMPVVTTVGQAGPDPV